MVVIWARTQNSQLSGNQGVLLIDFPRVLAMPLKKLIKAKELVQKCVQAFSYKLNTNVMKCILKVTRQMDLK